MGARGGRNTFRPMLDQCPSSPRPLTGVPTFTAFLITLRNSFRRCSRVILVPATFLPGATSNRLTAAAPLACVSRAMNATWLLVNAGSCTRRAAAGPAPPPPTGAAAGTALTHSRVHCASAADKHQQHAKRGTRGNILHSTTMPTACQQAPQQPPTPTYHPSNNASPLHEHHANRRLSRATGPAFERQWPHTLPPSPPTPRRRPVRRPLHETQKM